MSCLCLQSHCAQVDSTSAHCHQPDTEGELAEVLPRQEVQAEGPACEEDTCHPTCTHQVRVVSEDEEDAEETAAVPNEEVRRQGVSTHTTPVNAVNKSFSKQCHCLSFILYVCLFIAELLA